MSETPSLVGQVISGCEILQKTAEGGMGAVYRARHKALDRIVCVKILSPALSKDKKAVELFLTEARAIAELDHPNIVNVYNVGKENGLYFIVMSYIEGQTLSAILKKDRVLNISYVLDLFDGVLQGLAAAHEKGIIHRDIKPSNILVTPQGQAKLVDFGIAKKVDKSTGSTKTTELAGTAYFIAPEQALGKNLDTRADLYSIGASLYYVLTGHFPYNGKNTIEIIQKHINDPVPDPAKLRKELPTWLAEAIQKLMNKNPDDRFQSAKEVYLHFRKMRAEDQLRVKYGSAGRAIDLGSEGPLQVATEDKHSAQTLRAQRAGAKGFSSSTQPTFNKSMLPQINVEQLKEEEDETPQRSSSKTPSAQMLSADEVKPVNVFTPVRKKTRRKPSQAGAFLAQNLKNLGLLFLFLPLLAIFGAVVVYTFYSLGQICSVHVSSTSGLLHNIVAPFMVSSYAPNQLLLTGICFIVVTVIFASSAIRAFSRSTTTLLFLAIVSFFAGLFTPEVPFMEIKEAGKFLFSPEYYLCYLVLALVWGISLCWKLNRSASQGILAAVLVLFTVSLAFLSSHLSIPPNQQEALFTAILYTALFCGICSCYYLIARSHKDSILLPCCLFLLAVCGVWTYAVSGLITSMEDTLAVLIPRVEVQASVSSLANDKLEKELDLDTKRDVFKNIDHSNELTGLSLAEASRVLEPRIERAAPGIFNEQTKPLFAELLALYHRGGEDKMKEGVWEYALTFPIHNFNNNAQKNNAYFFLITLLYVFGLCNCAGVIFFGDDL